jgi:hypothetical protein
MWERKAEVFGGTVVHCYFVYAASKYNIYSELYSNNQLEPLKKHTFILNFIPQFSSYRAVNTLRLGYKNQSVNAVQ